MAVTRDGWRSTITGSVWCSAIRHAEEPQASVPARGPGRPDIFPWAKCGIRQGDGSRWGYPAASKTATTRVSMLRRCVVGGKRIVERGMRAIDNPVRPLVHLLQDDHLLGGHLREITPAVIRAIDRCGHQAVTAAAGIIIVDHILARQRRGVDEGQRVVDRRIVEWPPGVEPGIKLPVPRLDAILAEHAMRHLLDAPNVVVAMHEAGVAIVEFDRRLGAH